MTSANPDHGAIDYSIVVTAHGEGRLLHRTLRCIESARNRADSQGIATELIVVADGPSDETQAYISQTPIPLDRVIEVDNKSVGSSRMDGLSAASGQYAMVIDGDDLVSTNWIMQSLAELQGRPPFTVAHPEFTIAFGGKWLMTHHKGSDEEGYHPASVLDRNPWTSTIAAETTTFEAIKYEVGPDGLGYEDWHFLTEVLARGGQVRTVPRTCKFYRVKSSGSRFSEQQASSALIPRSSLFEPIRFLRYVAEPNTAEAETMQAWPRRFRGSLRHMRAALTSKVPALLPVAEGAYESAHLVGARLSQSRDFPRWLSTACEEIHQYEPELFADNRVVGSRRYDSNPPPRLGSAYAQLCRAIHQPPTHLVLVPWLKRGGADLEAINYAKLLAEESRRRVLVMATDPDGLSPWQTLLPSSVQFVDFGSVSSHLASDVRILLLANTLVQWAPDAIHNLNSREAWEAYVQFGPALSSSAMFASVFCADRSPSGQLVGYPFEYLPHALRHLSGLFADNDHILGLLDDVYHLDGVFNDVHYQPAPEASLRACLRRDRLTVLWAGRLDRQRRPDILGEVASLSADLDLPIDFDVYGSTMLDRKSPRLPRLPNLRYRGPFDRLSSIDVSRYDLFLNTSQWDGMPNVLLEATSLGLPIVSSAVGGIPELIEHDVSGRLVDPFNDISGYVAAFKEVLADRDLPRQWGEAALSVVEDRHSWDSFRAAVKRAPGYLSPQGRGA